MKDPGMIPDLDGLVEGWFAREIELPPREGASARKQRLGLQAFELRMQGLKHREIAAALNTRLSYVPARIWVGVVRVRRMADHPFREAAERMYWTRRM